MAVNQFDVNNKPAKKTKSPFTIFNWARPNKLHKFASYTPLWTLSALTQAEIEEPQLLFGERGRVPHDIIIKSAGITNANSTHYRPNPHSDGTLSKEVKRVLNDRAKKAIDEALEEYKKHRDLYFESVRMTCIPPFNEDRPLTSVTKIEMVVNEPMGISLLKRLRAAAANNGYVDHVDAPYLLTLEFRGWNEKGHEVSKEEATLLKRIIPVKLVNMQLDVSQNGTVYNLRAIPYNEFGYLNRYAYLRTSGRLTKDARLADTVQELQDLLNKQNKDEKELHRLVKEPDEYIFKVHPLFGEKPLIINKTIGSIKMSDQHAHPAISYALNQKLVGQVKQGDFVIRILADLMKMIKGFGDDVFDNWRESVVKTRSGSYDERNPNERAKMAFGDDYHFDYFKIRTSVVPIKSRWDALRKTHPKKITYYIEPFKINGYSLAIPGVSPGRDQIPFVYKNYNYIFTGENVDILDLNINYRVAYYQSKLKRIDATNERRINIVSKESTVFKDGPEEDIEPNLLTKSEVVAATQVGASTNNANGGIIDQFMDSLTHPSADMVKVQMRILGDIAYLGFAQFIPPSFKGKSVIDKDDNINLFRGSEDAVYNDKMDCYNPDIADPVVNLQFRFPTDRDTSTGLYELSDEESATFSGLYRVYKVENNFEQGQFTQDLHMVRFLNQGDVVTKDAGRESVIAKIDGTVVGTAGKVINQFDHNSKMSAEWKKYKKIFGLAKERSSKLQRGIKIMNVLRDSQDILGS